MKTVDTKDFWEASSADDELITYNNPDTTHGQLEAITPTNEFIINTSKSQQLSITQANTIAFFCNKETLGVLYLEKPMRFEGDTKRSAKIFMNTMLRLYDKQLVDLHNMLEEALSCLERGASPPALIDQIRKELKEYSFEQGF